MPEEPLLGCVSYNNGIKASFDNRGYSTVNLNTSEIFDMILENRIITLDANRSPDKRMSLVVYYHGNDNIRKVVETSSYDSKATVVIPSEAIKIENIAFRFFVSNELYENYESIATNIQLELGTEATPYVPHTITIWQPEEV